MAKSPIQVSDSTAPPDVHANLASFARHLRAENKAPSTITTYARRSSSSTRTSPRPACHVPSRTSTGTPRGVPRGPPRARRAPATVSQRYRSLAAVLQVAGGRGRDPRDAHGEHVAAARPARAAGGPPRGRPPRAPGDLLRRPSSTSGGTTRYPALPRYRDAPRRAGRAAASSTSTSCATSRSFSARAGARASARSVARRPRRSTATSASAAAAATPSREWLWLGKRGRLTDTGVEQVVKRRAAQAGLSGSTRTCSAIPTRTRCWPTGWPRATSCRLADGAVGRCSTVTAPPRRTSGLVPRTASTARAIGYECDATTHRPTSR